MTQPAKSHEPSMEEILASIRRIIADDDSKPEAQAAAPAPVPERPKPPAAAAPPAPPAKPAPPAMKPAAAAATNNQDDIDALLAGFDAAPAPAPAQTPAPPAAADVLELTEQMAVKDDDLAGTGFEPVQTNDDLEFTEPNPPPAPPPERPRTNVTPMPSFAEPEPAAPPSPLMSTSTVTAVNSAFNALAQTVLSNNARTLEDLVKEMLRPMLKGWLDDNLPGLVEKIVRAEIERVSRGR